MNVSSIYIGTNPAGNGGVAGLPLIKWVIAESNADNSVFGRFAAKTSKTDSRLDCLQFDLRGILAPKKGAINMT